MYALCVGVRDQFFSLSTFSEEPETVQQRIKDLEEAWSSSYRLDPSWDERINGQGSDSLVWCRDGANVLTEKHLENGFFAFVIKESKDSEIRVWDPAPKLTKFVFVNAFSNSDDKGLRIVRTFGPLSTAVKSYLYRSKSKPFSVDHLYWWFDTVSDHGSTERFLLHDQLSLRLREQNDSSNH